MAKRPGILLPGPTLVMSALILAMIFLSCTSMAYNFNTEEKTLTPIGGRMQNSLYGWSLQHFNDKLYVGAPKTNNPTSNAVTECLLTPVGICTNVAVAGGGSGLEQDEWMGGSMAAGKDNLYVCAFLRHRKHWAKRPPPEGGSITGAAISGACYALAKGNNQKLTEKIDFFQFKRETNKQQNLYGTYGHWKFRKEGGQYGFTAAIAADEQKLVVGNPMQRSYVYKRGAHACGSVGEVNDGNVFKAPGNYHHNRKGYEKTLREAKKTEWFTPNAAYLNENHASNENNLGKHASFALATGKFISSGALSYVMGAPNSDTIKGAVYLCTDCFGRDPGLTARMQVDYKSFLDESHLKMGEGFGMAVAACDVDGDNLDDLIVGSPLYSDPDNDDTHNMGRVHVFLSKNKNFQWLGIDGNAAMLDPPPHPYTLKSGARFGSAVTCLGDTDGDGKEEFAVGAPYFSSTEGAVFIYANHNHQMKLTQIIKMAEKSFGLRLSQDRLVKNMAVPGLGVGAPEVSKAFYLRARPFVVFSLQDQVVEIVPARITKDTTNFTLKVAPTVRWDPTGWQGADAQLNKVQVTATITVTPRGPTRNIFNRAKTETKTFYLKPRTGNQKVDFVYENYAERFGDNQELEFNVQIKYQLPSCAQSYQNNCPLIAHNLNQKLEASGHTAIVSKDYQAASVNLSPQESDFPINFCENDPCQCDVGLKVTKEASFVAGADDVGPEGALLATLELENSGAETAYNIEVTINLGGDSALFDLADRTRCVGNKCTIKIIENGATETMEIRVKSRETIPPTLKQITATITTSTTCYRPAPQEQVASVKVIQKWALRSNAPKQQQVTWEYGSPGGLHPFSLYYTIKNQGPSVADGPKVYILLPKNQLFLPKDPNTKAGLVPDSSGSCSEVTMNSEIQDEMNKLKGRTTDDVVSLSCIKGSTYSECQVFECSTKGSLQEMPAKRTVNAEIKMSFNKTAVENDKEGRTVFSVSPIVCGQTSEDGVTKIACDKYGKGTVEFDYYPLDLGAIILNNWELVGGAVIGIIVIIITFIIFWKCNCFQKVRYYDKKFEEEEEMFDDEMDLDGCEMDEVELRS